MLRATGLRSPRAGPIYLELQSGECVCVVGRSGAGKSVFLRMLADLDPCEGEVTLKGTGRATWTGPEWRRQVVYLAAEPAWWEPTPRPHFTPATQATVEATLQALGLSSALLDQPLAQLSTGQRQRLALVRAIAHEPPVLLLDEATASLDPEAAQRVERVLQARLAAGTGIVWVTHSPEQARRMGHRVLTLADGKRVSP